jgi:hypothetical protein
VSSRYHHFAKQGEKAQESITITFIIISTHQQTKKKGDKSMKIRGVACMGEKRNTQEI